ncbi:hypothetical protein DL546_004854 [Coniochaeta pulveracea]|uniref:Uncharacterized protein n=1 Tax=Coniochaeta pulveracea TaxID=177199 RepID=A0A420Y404_9PEZI|nr:hypothetical protein DL546_004854 [Coniochaeta pulveracea]
MSLPFFRHCLRVLLPTEQQPDTKHYHKMEDQILDTRPSIELSWAIKRQFYPTVVLLISLLRIFKFRPQRRVDHLLDTPLHGTELLHNFKDKLAFLCCTEYGSNAVSACTILRRVDDTLEYVFAFNQVSCLDLSLRQLKKGIEDVLQLFRQESPFATRKDAILSHVLAFNAIRVKAYLKSYHGHLKACIEACTTHEIAKGELLSKRLESLLSETERALGSSPNRGEVNALATRKLVTSVYETYHSDDFRLVQAHVTREEQNGGGDQYLPWAELVHVSGRLISYKRAVEVCQMAFTRWPSLLEAYEVVIVPSSTPTDKVLNVQALSAEGCMGKTTSPDTPLRQVFDAQYDWLRLHFRLDDKVAEIWKSKPKPFVHSEMQLLHMLEHTEGGTNNRRFFEGDMFIGTSKPPCRLCSYYFHECGTEVEIRPSHRNVYLPWRTPDVYDQQGVQSRDETYRKIKRRLEKDLHEILKTSTGDGRLHDSTNYSEAVADQSWSDVGVFARSQTTTPAMGERVEEQRLWGKMRTRMTVVSCFLRPSQD